MSRMVCSSGRFSQQWRETAERPWEASINERFHKDNLRHLSRFPDFFVFKRILSAVTISSWDSMVCVMPQSAKKEEKKTNASQDSSQQYHYKGLETRRSQINEISMVRSFLKTNEKPSYIQTRQQSVQPWVLLLSFLCVPRLSLSSQSLKKMSAEEKLIS